jgi:hypothetical protein
MASYFYSQAGQQRGPATGADIKQLVLSGQLLPDDLIWTEGWENWLPAKNIKGLFPDEAKKPTMTPPPMPKRPVQEPLKQEDSWATFADNINTEQKPVMGIPIENITNSCQPAANADISASNTGEWLNQKIKMSLVYKIGLLIALISLCLPWVTASSKGTMASIPGYTKGFSSSISVSLMGFNLSYGIIVLILCLIGGVLSLVPPDLLLKEKTKFAAAGIGALVMLFAFLSIFYLPPGMIGMAGNYSSSSPYASAESTVGPGFGIYTALISGLTLVLAGFFANWEEKAKQQVLA